MRSAPGPASALVGRCTTPNPPAPTTPSAPPPRPSTTSAAATSPAEVVQEYFAAINAGDYRRAWHLGGDNLNSTYGSFAAGFAGSWNPAATTGTTDRRDPYRSRSGGRLPQSLPPEQQPCPPGARSSWSRCRPPEECGARYPRQPGRRRTPGKGARLCPRPRGNPLVHVVRPGQREHRPVLARGSGGPSEPSPRPVALPAVTVRDEAARLASVRSRGRGRRPA